MGNQGGGGGGGKPNQGGGGGGGKPNPNYPSTKPHQPSGPGRGNTPKK